MPKANSLIQLQDNGAGVDIAANGTPLDLTTTRGNPKTLQETWSRTTTDATMVKETPMPSKSKDEDM